MIIGKENPLHSYDPSRYTVYQMLDYALRGTEKKLIQHSLPDMLLSKIDPYQDDLYNYAHLFTTNLSELQLIQIQNFFWKQPFRIAFPQDIHVNDFLSQHWYLWKDNWYIMVQREITENLSMNLPEHVVIVPVHDRLTLQHYKEIFSLAFQKTSEQAEQKFWFYDPLLLNLEDTHINAFILYENNTPVATGAYYAFDKFSIENIGTIPEARGKWYAQMIMIKLLQEAKRLGYHATCLVASESGSHVYKKLGFEILHEITTFTSPLLYS